MTNETVIAYDPETLLIALKVFRKYFGRKPGKGAWPLDHDMKQYYFMLPMIQGWEELYDSGEYEHNAALNVGRELGMRDRKYMTDVLHAYHDVREEHGQEI